MTSFTPWTSLFGGALIGLASVALLLFSGRIAGIAGILRRALVPESGSRPFEAALFIAGLVSAPLLWRWLSGVPIVQSVPDNYVLMAVSGLLVGFGAVWGSGCTSGHGVCGLSRLSPRSIAATITFMAVAIATVYVARHVVGPGT